MGDADFRTSVPARSLSEITTQQVNDWVTERSFGEEPEQPDYPIREFAMVAMFRYFRDMEMPELGFATSLTETDRFAAFFYTREQIEQVLGYCNQIQWLLLVKLSFDCGLRITELRNRANEYQRQDDCIYWQGQTAEVHMSRKARRKD